jgi:hypothetical protein
MSPVTVLPERFELVYFDPDVIREAVEEAIGRAGLGSDLDLTVEVDETSTLSDARLIAVDPPVIRAASGSFEDRSRPRTLSKVNTADEVTRVLHRWADRRSAAFSGAPAEAELTAEQDVAWDVYAMGRAMEGRACAARARLRYDFGLRFGFTEPAMAAFERLRTGRDLGWADVEAAVRQSR